MIAKPQTIVQYSCCGCLGMFPVLLAVLVTGTRAWSFNISCQGKMIAKPQTIVQYSCCGCLGMFPVLLAVLVTGTRAWS